MREVLYVSSSWWLSHGTTSPLGVQVSTDPCQSHWPAKSIIHEVGVSFIMLDSRRGFHSASGLGALQISKKTHLKPRLWWRASLKPLHRAMLQCVIHWPSRKSLLRHWFSVKSFEQGMETPMPPQ